jgi:hypothetical protein
MTHARPRMILAVATEAADDTTFIWDRLQVIQREMFAAGPIEVKFAYFGAEGALQVRPFIATSWATTARDMQDIMARGRAGCVCGCYVNVSDILKHTLEETKQAPVQAVVIVADSFYNPGRFDAALDLARQLRVVGVKLFLFQSSARSRSAELEALAKATGGAFIQFNPNIERIAEQLPETMTALAHFAVGGIEALAAQDTESAALLLEQMSVPQIIATRK